ncbi:SGNH/GDSL hydrolase family protein [Streptomyces sp. RKCA744]|uniref:SGNH/GDSL hydrolase family protein n=1 Tax=Streptomyces sp. RKCA744 TaxID=2959340 RepID=UPI0020A040D0|nr:SGNH/GDSL hydrolase family protein [Streptomyces sp. RKCA744]MCO8308811.1 SGNH/GDSL hydrolase family protein [Streptomyces sp. RKCA744]
MNKHLIALGDSLSVGIGDEPGPDGAPLGWIRRLLDFPGPDRQTDLLLNLGVVNARTPQVRFGQLPTALRHTARCAALITGMNDALTKFAPQHYERDYAAVVAGLAEHFPLVLTATLPDISAQVAPDPGTAARIRTHILTANDIIRKASARHDTVCFDAWAATAMAPDVWSPDGLHPNARGYAGIATAYRDLIGIRVGSSFRTWLEKSP